MTYVRLVCAALAFSFAMTSAGTLGAAPAQPLRTAAYGKLQTLARTITFTWAKRHPLVATSEGLTDYDGDLEIPSAAYRTEDLAQVRTWRASLAAIDLTRATLVERDDALLLRAQLTELERTFTVYRSDEKDYSGPA